METAFAFAIGFVIGALLRRKDKDCAEDIRMYERQIKAHEETIAYYKDLCKWHAERNRK